MPVESRISVNGIEVALFEWPGQDPPVFLCHATGFHARCWDQIIAHLPGRHCFALDTRGHGRSSKPAPPYAWRNFGTDVAAVAETLGLSAAIGVGHSMGGHAVTLAAALRPESFSSLLLIDPVIRPRGAYVGPWLEAHFVSKRRNRWASAQEMFDRFRQDHFVRRHDRHAVRAARDRGLHLHDEALAPGGRQDPRPVHRPVLADYAAALGRQGPVRRTALRRNGSLGAPSLRRRLYSAGTAYGQVRRRVWPRQDLRSDCQR